MTFYPNAATATGNVVTPAYQFKPETYGAKGDAKMLYDANMDGSTAILKTAGLPAPAAPTLAHANTGGTVANGTYLIQVTYVNAFGETTASSSTSVTTTGSNVSTITVTSPAARTNATAYYVYCTQAGGGAGTETRQQTVGSPTALRTNYVISAPPTNTGASTPGANTSASAPFLPTDVGKSIIVPSAGGFLNVPLVTTIASYQSASQVTLAHVSSSAVTGYGAVYGTDDTTALQNCINAAVAYAQRSNNEQAICEVVLSNTYAVAGTPGGTLATGQLVLPYINSYVGPKVELKFTLPQKAQAFVHWEQPNPPMPLGTIVSIYYNDSGSPGVPNPAVISGPITGMGGDGGEFSNMRVSGDLNLLVAYRCCMNGLDLTGVAQADLNSFGYFAMAATLGDSQGGWPPYVLGGAGNPSAWQCSGYICPTTGNNAMNHISVLTVYGPYYGWQFTDHFHGEVVGAIFCEYACAANANGSAHHCFMGTLVSEGNVAPMTSIGGDQTVFVAAMQAENANNYVVDSGNHLYGHVYVEQEGNTGYISAGKSGGSNLRLMYDETPLGVVSSPVAVPATTTPLTNAYWRDALVTITSGGAAVTVIAVDGVATGLTLGASGSVSVMVRSGGTITLTYASTAPTWSWTLF